MLLYKKIRLLRLNKGWSQETMAHKLNMSTNCYGCVERGETNMQVSRIVQIAQLLDVSIAELFQENIGKNPLSPIGNNNTVIQNNNNVGSFNSREIEYLLSQHGHQIEFNAEKQNLIIKQQNKEITLLKRLNGLLHAHIKVKQLLHIKTSKEMKENKSNLARRSTDLVDA